MIDRDRLIKAWKIFRDSNPYEICNGREFMAIKEPEYCMGQMIEDTIALLKEQDTMMQCIKGKCRICPHCANCDVDENGLLKEQADRMMDEKEDEMQDLIDCAYKNIGNAKSANDGMTALTCMLGSIAHSLVAIAVMMRDNYDK